MKLYNRITTFLVIVLSIMLLFAVFKIRNQQTQIKKLTDSQVCLLKGEMIDYFDLIGTGNQRINEKTLAKGKHLIFVMKQPCLPCNHNLTLWRRMAKIAKNEADVYGIWLGHPTEMFQFQESGKLEFTLYSPVEPEIFIKKMRLNLNYAQTILYENNQISYLKLGDLEGIDYTEILKRIKHRVTASESQ